MATYKKKDKTAKKLIKDQRAVEAESTTKEVFEGLDAGANKIEDWIIKRQKPLLIAIGAVVVLSLAYLAYTKYIQLPKEKRAADELAYPKMYFEEAMKMTQASDSLFRMSLNGDGAKYGFIDIMDNYSGTDAANLAEYYAGMAYYKLADFKNAIQYLDNYSGDDLMMAATAKGRIGDAFAETKKWDEAYNYYLEAGTKFGENNLTTPFYLDKAANAARVNGDLKEALKLLQRIKEEYPSSLQARDIEAKINQVNSQ
jgi:tetratricopeptide (TPR) repeat protein